MARADNVFMGTTEVPADKTAAEIVGLLGKAGAKRITLEHGDEGEPIAIEFGLMIPGFDLPFPFTVPVRTEKVFKILQERRNRPHVNGKFGASANVVADRAAALRIAWRQLYRWLEAQLAMVDAGMVKPQEVFMPYLLDKASGKTLFELLEGNGFKQIASATPEQK